MLIICSAVCQRRSWLAESCASACNHAQGFAYSCTALNIKGVVFMPSFTPNQKLQQTKMFGEDNIQIVLVGDTFDDCTFAAKKFTAENGMTFIPPFDDYRLIEGQGTVGVEVYEDLQEIDFVFIPVGENIERFVDGAVKRVGDISFAICKEVLDDIHLVAEGKVCSTILQLYNEDAIVVEPAGALSIAVLDDYKDQIKGKNVVCIVSGSNTDIDRMQEIKERSLQYEGLKHYFWFRVNPI